MICKHYRNWCQMEGIAKALDKGVKFGRKAK